MSRLRRHHILLRHTSATRRARFGWFLHRPSLQTTQGLPFSGTQRGNRGLAMTSAIITYLHRRKSRQAKAQAAASTATGRRLISSTWDATAATGERESEDNANKAADGHRQPDGDEADNLAPARGIAISVLVGIAMWLAIVALARLITGFLV